MGAIVCQALGFAQEKSRHFVHPKSKYYVEFPGSATMIGDEPISEFGERQGSAKTYKEFTARLRK